jgi:peptide/nickel transport system substrate-binding protein
MNRTLPALLMAAALAATLLNGCQSSGTGENRPEPGRQEAASPNGVAAPVTGGYHQSPFLEGKGLPPVEQRLPKEPKLTNELPREDLNYEIGRYGGTLRTIRSDAVNDSDLFIIENEPLVNSPALTGDEITPNIVKSFQVSDDQKTFTFQLREGMKWSDGAPVTMDDVKFAVEDVLFNKELTPSVPLWLQSADGTPFSFQVIDDLTFQIRFSQPYGGFLTQLAVQGWRGYTDLLKPKHYLRQFHIKYTPLEQLQPKIREAGFEPGEWTKLFTSKDVLNNEITYPKAIGFPVLCPYIQVKTGDVIEFERNPYYFKVDAKGNQLPYIDKLQSTYVQNMEIANLKILSGNVDHSYEYVTLPKVALLKENEQKGGYKIYLNKLHRTSNDIELNLTYDDPVWRQVVRDLRFRKALNLALDKKEIADTIFYGFAKPSTIEPAEYNLEEAGRMLDEMGMTKGPDGFRIGPDGKKFVIPFEISSASNEYIGLAQLVAGQWKKLGIDVTVKQIDGALWSTRNKANQLQATVMSTPGPVQWVRQEWGQNIWAPLWDAWYTSGGKQGEEPPPEAKELLDSIYRLREYSHQEALVKREEIKKNLHDNLWYFIHSEDIAAPVAVNANIGNFSDKGWGISQNFAGEQWFFRK